MNDEWLMMNDFGFYYNIDYRFITIVFRSDTDIIHYSFLIIN